MQRLSLYQKIDFSPNCPVDRIVAILNNYVHWNVDKLDLSGNNLGNKTPDELAAIFKAIPTHITELDLSNNGLEKELHSSYVCLRLHKDASLFDTIKYYCVRWWKGLFASPLQKVLRNVRSNFKVWLYNEHSAMIPRSEELFRENSNSQATFCSFLIDESVLVLYTLDSYRRNPVLAAYHGA